MILQHQMPNKNHSDPESSHQHKDQLKILWTLNVLQVVSVRKKEDYLIFNAKIGLAIHGMVNNKTRVSTSFQMHYLMKIIKGKERSE